VSMRVRDAAEALLTAVIDYVVCTSHLLLSVWFCRTANSKYEGVRVK